MSKYSQQLQVFALLATLFQVTMIVLYGVFVRIDNTVTSGYIRSYLPWLQDMAVMTLIGFGYLYALTKTNALTALGYTFFINALAGQEYLLFNGLWEKAFMGTFSQQYINLNLVKMIQSTYCVASVLVAFGAIVGRVGPLEMLIMSTVQVVGYSLNQRLITAGGIFTAYDSGGSMTVFTFGACFGITVSYILGRKDDAVEKKPTKDFVSGIFAFLGSLFLWMYFPSFNSALLTPTNQFQRTMAIANTLLSLTGSVFTAFIASVLLRGKVAVEDVLLATIAGGVIVGSSCSLNTNTGGSITIGCIAGFLATIGNTSIKPKLEEWGIYDTASTIHIFLIPGLLGGVVSAIFMAAYTSNGLNTESATVNFAGANYNYQGGLQAAGTFLSMGLGIAFGLVAALIIRIFYSIEKVDFFEDKQFWEIHPEEKHDK